MKKPDSLDVEAYRPPSGRRRLLIAALAIVTALLVMWLMLRPQLRLIEVEQARKGADAPPCAAQQTQGCVGGTMGVIGAPAATASASASAPRSPASTTP